MKKYIACFCMALSVASSYADDSAWIDTAVTKKHIYQAKKGSFEIIKNKSAEDIAMVTGRTQTKSEASPSVILEKWYVRVDDCKKSQGKIVTLSIGGEFKYDNDFVFDGGNVSSAKAEFICGVYDFSQEEKRKKGI